MDNHLFLPHHFPPASLTIDTPELFEKFKKGIIGTDYETVYVEHTAHPDLLSEVKHFSHLKNFEIRFKDSHHNVMTLFPRHDRVKAFFWNGDQLAQYIPNVHKVYDIVYGYKAFLTDDELNVIFQLSSAEKLTLTCDRYFQLTADLEQRLHGMRNMVNLDRLVLDIAEPNSVRLQLTPFLLIPPAIHEALFILPTTMSVKQRIEFAKNQKLPHPWTLGTDLDVHWLSFKKQ